jgi:tetratricopeptide (TPR) repeat protein
MQIRPLRLWALFCTAALSALAAQDFYSLGLQQYAAHRFAEAEGSFQRVIDADNNNAEAYKALGRAQVELKKYNEAYHTWLKAERLNPKDAKTKYYLGRLFYEADFPNQAAAWLRETLKLAPHDYAAMTYLGLSAEALSYGDVALKLYRNAIAESVAAQSPYSWAFLSLGKLLQKRGEADEAFKILEQGSQKCPESHELSAFGQLLMTRNQPRRAEQVLRHAITLDPSLSEAHYRLALLLESSGRAADAKAEMAAFQLAKEHEREVPKITAIRK